MSGFYDRSNMVGDIPREPAPAAQEPAPAPPAPPAASTADKDVALFADDTASEKKTEPEAPSRSPFAADVMPYGPEHGNSVRTLAEANGEDAETAQAVADAAVRNMEHYGLPGNQVENIVAACSSIASGPPDAATTESWRREALEGLASDYRGQEGAAEALKTARAWVAKHPELSAWLQKTRLGDHPRVIRAIAATAHQARKDGRKF